MFHSEKFLFLQTCCIVAQNELSILIVEDDLSFSIELEMLIQDTGYRVAGRVDNSADALEFMLMYQPDLVLMDIDIKGNMSGIEIAEKLGHLEIPTLFITSYGDEKTYQRAQQTGAIGYLVKPIAPYTLRTAIKSVINNITKLSTLSNEDDSAFLGKESLYFRRRSVYQKVTTEEISYVKANGDYTAIYSHGKEYSATTRFRDFIELLPQDYFLQIHRSIMINMNKITSIDITGSQIWVDNVCLPVSRRLRKQIFERINVIK